MRYLKTYKIFESFDDDADTMARYQLFGADTTMAFNFNREHITDVESIKDLIEKYNEFYVTGKSWSGGPPPRAFVEYFNKNYSEKGNASLSSWYPTIDLMIETLNYGTLILGFSIIDKSYKLINWGSLEATGQYAGKDVSYDKRVLSEISKYINKELIDKLNMYEVIDILNLKITNKVDWDWKERFNEGTYEMTDFDKEVRLIEDNINDILLELNDLYITTSCDFVEGRVKHKGVYEPGYFFMIGIEKDTNDYDTNQEPVTNGEVYEVLQRLVEYVDSVGWSNISMNIDGNTINDAKKAISTMGNKESGFYGMTLYISKG